MTAFPSKYGDFERFPAGSSRPSRALPFSTKGADEGDSGHPADDGRPAPFRRPESFIEALMQTAPGGVQEESTEEVHARSDTDLAEVLGEALSTLSEKQLQIVEKLGEGLNPTDIEKAGVASRFYVYKTLHQLRAFFGVEES